METFGKSGSRRIVPGQYLAIDPKGRAVMIGRLSSNSCIYRTLVTNEYQHSIRLIFAVWLVNVASTHGMETAVLSFLLPGVL